MIHFHYDLHWRRICVLILPGLPLLCRLLRHRATIKSVGGLAWAGWGQCLGMGWVDGMGWVVVRITMEVERVNMMVKKLQEGADTAISDNGSNIGMKEQEDDNK